MGPQEGRQGLRRDEFDRLAKHVLQQVAEFNEVIERLLPRCELDERVDVAPGARGIVSDRTEEREALHTRAENVWLGGGEARRHVGTGRGGTDHAGDVPSPGRRVTRDARSRPRPPYRARPSESSTAFASAKYRRSRGMSLPL